MHFTVPSGMGRSMIPQSVLQSLNKLLFKATSRFHTNACVIFTTGNHTVSRQHAVLTSNPLQHISLLELYTSLQASELMSAACQFSTEYAPAVCLRRLASQF